MSTAIRGDKYGPSFQRLVKYADAANFAGEKVVKMKYRKS